MIDRIMKLLFGTECRLCFHRYRFGGGKIRLKIEDDQYHTMMVCDECCEIMEHMQGGAA